MKISKDLYEILKEWKAIPPNNMALCEYVRTHTEDPCIYQAELEALFESCGLDGTIPFNHNVLSLFFEESGETCHLNPNRIAFVDLMLELGTKQHEEMNQ